MRSAALLLSLCCAAGVAQAAPASDAEVAAVVTKLGLGSLGTDMAGIMVDNVPVLKALPDADRQCARGPIRDVLDAQYRRSLIAELGNDGDTVIAEWSRFLATAAGKGLSSSFAGSTPETTAANATAGLSEQERAQTAAFLDSPAFKRLTAALQTDSDLPDDLSVQVSKMLQAQCRIALKPEEIS